jgi:hypothetical protein
MQRRGTATLVALTAGPGTSEFVDLLTQVHRLICSEEEAAA